MNKLLRVTLIVVIIAMFSAAILQLFFPELMGENSEYGVGAGWQREIALWNLAMMPILIAIHFKYDPFWLKIILTALIIGGFGLGTNHLMGYIHDSSKLTSLVGAIENYTFVVIWIVGWKIENKKLVRNNHSSKAQ